jgi:hypothetical protein
MFWSHVVGIDEVSRRAVPRDSEGNFDSGPHWPAAAGVAASQRSPFWAQN